MICFHLRVMWVRSLDVKSTEVNTEKRLENKAIPRVGHLGLTAQNGRFNTRLMVKMTG